MNIMQKLFENNKYEEIIELSYKNINELEVSAKQFSTSWIDGQNKKDLELLLNFSQKNVIVETNNKMIKLFCDINYSLGKVIESKKKLELFSLKEFSAPESDIKYDIVVCNEEITRKCFIVYILIYYIQSHIRSVIYKGNTDIYLRQKSNVSIDYEFRRKEIALMQINFENPVDTKNKTLAYIWLSNPGKFTDRELDLFVNLIMLNSNIYKIFHGPDSLDIPYMYEHMFRKNKEIMGIFFSKMYDTRYFCEYYKLNKGMERSCSYYVSLLHFNTINQSKFDELENNRELMGPVQDINWDINNLSTFHLKYALYDVLLLSQHTRDLGRAVEKDDSENLYGYKYYNYFIRFIYMEQNKITDVIPYCKSILDPINNYIVTKNGRNYTLIKIFTNVIVDLVITFDKGKINYNFVSHVRLISNNLNHLIKLVVYYLCHELFDVYEKKNIRSKKVIDISCLYDLLKSYNLTHISCFVKGIASSVRKILADKNNNVFK